MDELEGKDTVFSQENPVYDSNMKLYQPDRYVFQHSGEDSHNTISHHSTVYSSLTYMTAEMSEFLSLVM